MILGPRKNIVTYYQNTLEGNKRSEKLLIGNSDPQLTWDFWYSIMTLATVDAFNVQQL